MLDVLQPWLKRFPYAALGLFGRENGFVSLRVADRAPAAPETIAALDTLFGLAAEDCAMEYRDARRGIAKRVQIREGKLTAVRLGGETAAREWLKEVMANGAETAAVRRWMLAPLVVPPADYGARGHIVCSCLGVGEREIRERLAAGAASRGSAGRTWVRYPCGSCLPELRRLCAVAAPSAEAAD